MAEKDVQIRIAEPADAAALAAIYAPYVENTAVTFEYTAPGPDAFRERMENIRRQYPYILAEQGGKPVGYAYAGPFVGREAYAFSAETTIYIRQDKRGQGLGRRLYAGLEALCRAQHILNLNACIACPEKADAYLTGDSLAFHGHMGYALVGEFHRCGYKFGTWYNMVWMEKMLGPHPAVPAPFIPFPGLSGDVLEQLGFRP